VDLDYRNLRELERVTFHIQDVTEVLSDVIWTDDAPYTVRLKDSAPLAAAMDATGELLASFDGGDEVEQRRLLAAAKSAVEAGMAAVAVRAQADSAVTASESILLSLHRILRAVRPAS
jgi:hypothetical protein